MARVIVLENLKNEILKKFKQESKTIFKLMQSLEQNPKKGKPLGTIGGILIKEIKYKSFRFYLITKGSKLKFTNKENLTDLLITFVRMSDKNSQQKTINEIKQILLNLDSEEF